MNSTMKPNVGSVGVLARTVYSMCGMCGMCSVRCPIEAFGGRGTALSDRGGPFTGLTGLQLHVDAQMQLEGWVVR